MQAYEQLEKEFAEWVGKYTPQQMAVCSSGTAALHLALEALQLPIGSEVFIPDYTMIACARAVTLAGLVPVLIDCGEDLLVDPGLIDKACSTRDQRENNHGPSAIMAVHVYGRPCDMDRIVDIACQYDLLVVEDLAEAHGITPHPLTDAACWSYYRNKIVAGEEGGAVAFLDEVCAERARSLRSMGFTEDHDYTHIPRGHNYRMSNCHASLVLKSLARTRTPLMLKDGSAKNGTIGWRREIEGWYDEVCPPEWRQPKREAVWVYDLRIVGMDGFSQKRVINALHDRGIEARYGFKPISTQQEYLDNWVVGVGNAKVASREVIYLPVQPGITTKEQCRIAMYAIQCALVQ